MNFKTKYVVLGIALIAASSWIYSQLFYQVPTTQADYLALDNTFTEHKDEVWSVKFSPNDSLLVSSGYDEDVLVWSRTSGKTLHKLKHPYGVPSSDFGQNGKTVNTASYDGKVRIWDVEFGEQLRTLDASDQPLRSVSSSPNSNLIAAGGDDDTMRMWNSETGELLRTFDDSEKDIWAVEFDPSGELLLSSGSDNLIRVYNVDSGELLQTLEGHSMVALSIVFSPDGKLLASASDDKTVKIWDTDDWSLIRTLKGDNEALHSVVFVDNKRVLAGGTDKGLLGEFLEYHFNYQGSKKHIVATLWDIQKGEILQTITEHENDLGTRIDVSTDGKWLATASSDKTVKIWSVK